MQKHSIGAACAAVLVALTGGLVTPTASHAAVYGGVFDPENANYKWFGNHVFNVDDSCLVGDGWKQVNSNTGYGCGNARLVGGDLTVVNKLGTPSVLDDVSKTLQFADFGFIPTSINPLNAQVWGVNIVGGELVGIDTFEIGNFTFANPGSTHSGQWTLEWSSGQGLRCVLYENCLPPPINGVGSAFSQGLTAPIAGNTASGMPSVTLRNRDDDVLNATLAALGPATTVSFRRIPEPTTVTLVLAALGAGWLTRRRSRR